MRFPSSITCWEYPKVTTSSKVCSFLSSLLHFFKTYISVRNVATYEGWNWQKIYEGLWPINSFSSNLEPFHCVKAVSMVLCAALWAPHRTSTQPGIKLQNYHNISQVLNRSRERKNKANVFTQFVIKQYQTYHNSVRHNKCCQTMGNGDFCANRALFH